MFFLAGVCFFVKSCVNMGESLLGLRESSDWWCLCPLLESCCEFSQTWSHIGSVFGETGNTYITSTFLSHLSPDCTSPVGMPDSRGEKILVLLSDFSREEIGSVIELGEHL